VSTAAITAIACEQREEWKWWCNSLSVEGQNVKMQNRILNLFSLSFADPSIFLISILVLSREIAEEKRQARINLVPVLQAEEDARWVKDESNQNLPQVYHGRWMPPAVNNPFRGVRPDNYK
jgi:hypothetical protein